MTELFRGCSTLYTRQFDLRSSAQLFLLVLFKPKTQRRLVRMTVELKMENTTYRRAQNCDSEVIKNILKETFEEYEINLPVNYSFSDIENLEEEYLNSAGEFIVLIRKQNIIGFFALLPSHNNQIELKRTA